MSKTGLQFLDEIEAAVEVPKEALDACYRLVVVRRDVCLVWNFSGYHITLTVSFHTGVSCRT
jgi:hypothetical protein